MILRAANRGKFSIAFTTATSVSALIFENAQLGRAIISHGDDNGRDGRERSSARALMDG